MTIDQARARAFVEANGTAVDRARAAALVERVAAPAVPEEIRALQTAEGGFPVGLVAGRPAALSPTCLVLAWLRDLGQADSPEARRALAFVVERQLPRGIWREQPAVMQFDPPLWMDPDSTAADIYTTALCAGTIAALSDDDLPVEVAATWLQTQQARDGLLTGFRAHASWLAVPAFARVLGQETRATRRLVGGLGSILGPEWSGMMLAWMLQSLLDAGYTRRTEVVDRAWQQLSAMQQPDGSFPVEEDEDPVQATLQALDVVRQLQRYG
jgi:squalene cyclase